MSKFSKPDQYITGLREHWKRQRKDKNYFDKRNSAVNECWRPSNEASRADLAEYHREEMRLKKAHRRTA